MTTPSAFKIVSLSTPSAFEANRKVPTPECVTLTLPLNLSLTDTVVYGSNGPYTSTLLPPLNLTGVCKVVLPNYGSAAGITEQYKIQNVTGLAAGQTVLFVNNNTGPGAKYFSFDASTDQNNIEYPPVTSQVPIGTNVLFNAPAVGIQGGSQIGVKVTNGGAGYTTAPTVVFDAAAVLAGFTATAVVATNGVVTNIYMTGYGATPPTTATLTPVSGGTGALAEIVSIRSMIINGLAT